MLKGKITDYGDLIHQERWIVKGRHFGWRWRLGPVTEVTVTDAPGSVSASSVAATGKADVIMDLRADQQVALSGQWTDEVGNPVPSPADFTVVFTVDAPTIINLTDNGDGTAVAAATGTLGTANVHAVANAPGLPTLTGDLQIVVVAGLAERFNVVAGTPEEVTPD